MKLGFLTAPFPETPLTEVADWAAASGFEVLEIACWPRTSGPINAIMIDPENGTFWGGSSNHGEDYGIGW